MMSNNNDNEARISEVTNIKLQSVNSSSVLQVGDSYKLKPFSRAIAVQREGALFLGEEGDFSKYEIFNMKLPIPYAEESVTTNFINECPAIVTENVYILSLAASSIFHIGSTKIIESEARVKHFRQLINPK
jgi:spore germination protein PE